MDPFKKPATPDETPTKTDASPADTVVADTPASVAIDSPQPVGDAADTASAPEAVPGDAPASTASDAPVDAGDKPAYASAPTEATAAVNDVPAQEVPASSAEANEPADAVAPGAEKPAEITSGATAPAFGEKPADSPAPGTVASSWNTTPAETTAASVMPDHISAPDTPPPATPDGVSAGGMAAVGGAAVVAAGVAKGAKKMRTLAVIVAAAVLLLLACGASALYYVMNKPQNVLDVALANSFSDKAKTVSFDGEVTRMDKDQKPSMSVTFNGAIGQDGKFSASAKADLMVTNVTADFRSVDGSTYYARVGGLSGLPQLLAGGNAAESKTLSAEVALVNDQWLEINQSLVKEITGSNVSTKLTDGDRSKLEAAYKQNKFVVVRQSLVDQVIKGVGTHHYRVGLDKAKLKGFYAAIQKANLDSMKLTSDQLSVFNKSLDDAKTDTYLVDVWVGKTDRMFKQVGYSKTNPDHSSVAFRLTVDKYNAAVNVEKPANAKSLLDVLGQFYGANGMPGMDGMTDMNPLMGLPSGISL